MKKYLLAVFIFGLILASAKISLAEEEKLLEINFFYSKTCLHCAAENKFLDKIEKEYPKVKIYRYPINDPKSQELLEEFCQKCGAEYYLGIIPITFVGSEFFIGFDKPAGVGKAIEESIQRQLTGLEKPEKSQNKIRLPGIGEIDIGRYSLPVLAVVLGILDGFNVCSLGALVLILGLTLTLRSRKKIFIYGGTFILTTAVIYGLLIVLWYQLFSLLAPYVGIMEFLIAVLGIGGGIYFLKQFIKQKKYGPACEAKTGQKIASKFSAKLQNSFQTKKILAIVDIMLLFAVIITIVEFPCSAVVPVVFAGILSKAELPLFVYLLYIGFYIIFYLLDEIIVYLVAVLKMTVWLSSGKFVIWITLIEAIALFLLGGYYLIGFF